jgi:chromosome partitioning protein
MKTIAVVSRKGGVGKSTLALNLATVTKKAVILDTDPQASCADWGDRRDKKDPPIVTVPAGRVRAAIQKQAVNWCFIDTQPSAEASLIEVAQSSDLCIIVLRPGQMELDALGATFAAIRLSSTKAVLCINQAHPQASHSDLIVGLEEHYPVGPIIRSRADFPASVAEGMGVNEWNSTGKAAKEIKDFWNWLRRQL